MAILQSDLFSLDYYFNGSPQVDASSVSNYQTTQDLDWYFAGSPYVANYMIYANTVNLTPNAVSFIGNLLDVKNTLEESNTAEIVSGSVNISATLLSVLNPEANTINVSPNTITFKGSLLSVVQANLLAGETKTHITHTPNDVNHLVDALSTFDTSWFWFPPTFKVGLPVMEDSLTDGARTAITYSIGTTTQIALSFLQDWYYRVHISYSPIQLGNITSTQYRYVDVWNAYFISNNLSAINPIALDGISIASDSVPIAHLYTPLQNITYEITVSDQGAPIIDGYFVFAFASGSAYLYIQGQRVLVWQFPPLLPFTESRNWLTNIIELRNGETKYQIREFPRLGLNYNFRFDNQEQLARARSFAHNVANYVMGLPQWSVVKLAGAISSGISVISVDTTYMELMAQDEIIIIYEDWDHYELLEVTSFTSSSITTSRNTELNYTKAFIAPVRVGYAKSGINITRGEKNELKAAIELTDIVNNYFEADWQDAETFLGLPILSKTPIVTGGLNDNVSRQRSYFDSDSWSLDAQSPVTYNRLQSQIRLAAHTEVDKYNLRRKLDYLKGKFSTFWLPTYNEDLVAQRQITNGVNKLYVKAGNWMKYAEKYIRVIGSSTAYFQVINVTTEIAFPGEEVLLLSPTPLIDITSIHTIDVMYKVRADADRFEYQYEAGAMKATISVIEEN